MTLFEKYLKTTGYKKKMALLKQIKRRENIISSIILALACFGFVSLMYFLWLYLTNL